MDSCSYITIYLVGEQVAMPASVQLERAPWSQCQQPTYDGERCIFRIFYAHSFKCILRKNICILNIPVEVFVVKCQIPQKEK